MFSQSIECLKKRPNVLNKWINKPAAVKVIINIIEWTKKYMYELTHMSNWTEIKKFEKRIPPTDSRLSPHQVAEWKLNWSNQPPYLLIHQMHGSPCIHSGCEWFRLHAYKNFKFFDNDGFSIKLWAVHLKESNCTLHTKRMSLHKTCNYFLMWVRKLSSFLLAKTSVNQKGFADKQRASSFVRKLEIKGMVWQDHAQVHILFQWLVHYYVMTFSIGNIMTGYHKYHPHVIWMQQTGHVDLRNFLLDLTMNGTVL